MRYMEDTLASPESWEKAQATFSAKPRWGPEMSAIHLSKLRVGILLSMRRHQMLLRDKEGREKKSVNSSTKPPTMND